MKGKSSKSICLLFPRFYEGFVMGKVPLGLAYLASALEAQGIRVEGYNLNVDEISEIDFSSFDFVGITCLTPFLDSINEICSHVLRANPRAKVIVGGPHPTYRTREVFKELPMISYAIVGEGEVALAELVKNEERYRNIKGVYYPVGESGVQGTPNEILDIDTLAYPDQRLFDHGRLEKRNPFRAILASRGCPYRCRNCQPILEDVQPFRLRKPEKVFEEVHFLSRTFGQEYFGFVDSQFPLNKSFLHSFDRLVRETGMPFSFHCNGRVDLLDEEILRTFKTMNITRLAIGIESGVQRVVTEVLHKRIDLDRAQALFRTASTLNLRTHAHFMIGIPGETLDDMQETLDFAMRLPTPSVEFNILTPWPGTAFWDICVSKGYLTETNCARFNEKRRCFVNTPEFSHEEVEAFYEHIRRELTSRGWRNSPDGSVYFHPELYHEEPGEE
jgi:radical SAM superfamily enzyme YgiQ (UPF0313 family)